MKGLIQKYRDFNTLKVVLLNKILKIQTCTSCGRLSTADIFHHPNQSSAGPESWFDEAWPKFGAHSKSPMDYHWGKKIDKIIDFLLIVHWFFRTPTLPHRSLISSWPDWPFREHIWPFPHPPNGKIGFRRECNREIRHWNGYGRIFFFVKFHKF